MDNAQGTSLIIATVVDIIFFKKGWDELKRLKARVATYAAICSLKIAELVLQILMHKPMKDMIINAICIIIWGIAMVLSVKLLKLTKEFKERLEFKEFLEFMDEVLGKDFWEKGERTDDDNVIEVTCEVVPDSDDVTDMKFLGLED